MKNSAVETVTGAIVIIVAIFFFTFMYKTADVRAGSGGYQLKANFESVSGITHGSDVRVSGIKVGTVVAQELDAESFYAVITMTIDPKIKLPLDSSAKVTSDGLLGAKYISVEPGGDETMLAAGDAIEHTQGSIDIFDMISKFLFQGDEKKAEKTE